MTPGRMWKAELVMQIIVCMANMALHKLFRLIGFTSLGNIWCLFWPACERPVAVSSTITYEVNSVASATEHSCATCSLHRQAQEQSNVGSYLSLHAQSHGLIEHIGSSLVIEVRKPCLTPLLQALPAVESGV